MFLEGLCAMWGTLSPHVCAGETIVSSVKLEFTISPFDRPGMPVILTLTHLFEHLAIAGLVLFINSSAPPSFRREREVRSPG